MSKELFKRVRDTLHGLKETHYDLYWDIQAELDKPEQEEQKPVAWMYEFTGKLHPSLEYSRVLLMLEKQGTSGWVRVESPLYLAPPKRKPSQSSREMYQRGYAAAERDLKPEPLSDEEINAIDLPEKQCTIREFVRIIEKAHGIGGGK